MRQRGLPNGQKNPSRDETGSCTLSHISLRVCVWVGLLSCTLVAKLSRKVLDLTKPKNLNTNGSFLQNYNFSVVIDTSDRKTQTPFILFQFLQNVITVADYRLIKTSFSKTCKSELKWHDCMFDFVNTVG